MGEDFVAFNNLNVAFEAGITTFDSQCASITILDDSGVECDHDFNVFSGDIECNISPAIYSTVPSVTVIIEDNDSKLVYHP